MLEFTVLLLALLAVAVVSFPRYHIQYSLARLWWQAGKIEYPDIRFPISKGFANLADVLILGAAMTNLVAYVFQKANIPFNL